MNAKINFEIPISVGDTNVGSVSFDNYAADDFEGFTVGDIVSLVTGSPDMVVVDVCECGRVDVVWYDEGGFNEASLPEEALAYA